MCEDYDLCEACESKNAHPKDHILVKLKSAVQDHSDLGRQLKACKKALRAEQKQNLKRERVEKKK